MNVKNIAPGLGQSTGRSVFRKCFSAEYCSFKSALWLVYFSEGWFVRTR